MTPLEQTRPLTAPPPGRRRLAAIADELVDELLRLGSDLRTGPSLEAVKILLTEALREERLRAAGRKELPAVD